jgi:hypothetical protein
MVQEADLLGVGRDCVLGDEATSHRRDPPYGSNWPLRHYTARNREIASRRSRFLRTRPHGPASIESLRRATAHSYQAGSAGHFLGKAIRETTDEIWGDGLVIRDYVHVSDAVAAMLAAVQLEGTNRIINVGTGKANRFTGSSPVSSMPSEGRLIG